MPIDGDESSTGEGDEIDAGLTGLEVEPTGSDRARDADPAPSGASRAVREADRSAPAVDRAPAADKEPAAEQKPPIKVRGRLLAFLGLLAGLAGLGAAGYLYFSLIYKDPQTLVNARLIDLENQLQDWQRSLGELEDQQQQALVGFAESEREERDASAERLLEAVNELASQAPPSRREWKVAEVSYLLRIANHRMLMERDVQGALALLRGADAILMELDDFALYQVRGQLSEEILSLENVQSNDVQGLFLRLEAIKTELRGQSPKLPRFADDESSATQEAVGFWAVLSAQVGSYLRFRRFDGASVKPLLAPEEAVYLELNLRLMLERAQLAALRREQVVYQQSLETAVEWMTDYLDAEDPAVQRSLDELDELSRLVLDRPLPDISGSLTALKSLGEV